MLDLQYKLLIGIFFLSLPIHFGNLLIVWGRSTGFSFMFTGLMIMAVGLVVLFGHLREQHRPRSFIQNILTLGSLFLVIGSTIKLFSYVFGL